MFKKLKYKIVIFICLICTTSCNTISSKTDDNQNTQVVQQDITTAQTGELAVTFLDVGQGNAVLIENDGAYMLIDGGDRDYSSFVVSYLQKQGVTELTYAVASHYDADHLNGVVGALNVFDCNTVLSPDYVADSKVYQSFVNIIAAKKVQQIFPAVGDTFYLGDASFVIVCPDQYNDSDENEDSVGIKLTYGNTSFLICGDAGTESEEKMLSSKMDIQADVYLAGHHGSYTSSSIAFLQAVQPSAVVISAGVGNPYGHPHRDVLTRIENIGADLYRTDLQGTIIVTSDGTNLSWNKEPTIDFRCGDEIIEALAGSTQSDSYEYNYVVNTNTKKFHSPSCSSITEMNENNKLYYMGSREDAIAAGYSPCQRCKP